MRFELLPSSIRIHGTIDVPFSPRPIEVADAGSMLVVVLDPAGVEHLPENVYGVDARGRVVWRVEPREFPHGRSPYVGVHKHGKEVTLVNRSGIEVRIDPTTGKILGTEFTR